MFCMVDHLLRHASVYADVLACDEACFVRAEEKYHVGNVERIANASYWLLSGIRTKVLRIISINPSW